MYCVRAKNGAPEAQEPRTGKILATDFKSLPFEKVIPPAAARPLAVV